MSGILKINIDPQVLSSSIKDAKVGKTGYIFILDNVKEGTFNFKQNGKNMYGVFTTYGTRGWKFVAVVPQSELASTEIGDIVNEVNNSIKVSLDISSNAKELFKEELQQVKDTIKSFDNIKTAIANS